MPAAGSFFGMQSLNVFEPVREKEWYEELEDQVCGVCPSMTYSQRLMGCGACMVMGLILSAGSTMRIVKLLKGDPIPFAVMYTFGNILAVSSSCFLYGPRAQAKQMFADTRFVTTLVYFTCMGATLYLAFHGADVKFRGMLLMITIFVQFLALCWYTLSFVPFARQFITSCCKDRVLQLPF